MKKGFKRTIKGISKTKDQKFTGKKATRIGIKAAIAGTALTGLVMHFASCNPIDVNESIHVANLRNDKDVEIYDENGNVITTYKGNDSIENPVISLEVVKKNGKKYRVYIADSNGDLKEGYVSGKDIEKSETIEIENFYDEEHNVNIGIVAASNGVYARQNKILEKNAQDAKLLERGTYVICGLPETSNDNSYTWRKIIYFEGDTPKTAYMADEYLLNIENLEENRKVRVITDILRVRQKPSTETGEVEAKLSRDDCVYVVPNVVGANDDKHDWIYIAYKDAEANEVKLGWIATNDKSRNVNYIEDVEEKVNTDIKTEETVLNEEKDTRIKRIVDTSSASYADLKLREAPGTSSGIKMKLANGTTVYVTERFLEESEDSKEINGHKWIKVILENGDTGYVASEYLIEAEQDKSEEKKIVPYKTVKMFGEGNIDGVVGIDVAPENMGIGNFEEILKGNLSISTDTAVGNLGSKPQFVIIKLGSTGYGDKFSIVGMNGKTDAESIENRKNLVRAFINKCEEYKIPYGCYYYSQAINEPETLKEIDYIVDIFSGMGNLKYNVLPIAVDIENLEGRMGDFAVESQSNKRKLTMLKQAMMENLRGKLGNDVIIYSDRNAMQSIIDYTLLSEENRDGIWLVDCSSKHSNSLQKMGLTDDIGIRQVKLDVSLSQTAAIDVDFMDLERYKEYINQVDGLSVTFKNEERVRE